MTQVDFFESVFRDRYGLQERESLSQDPESKDTESLELLRKHLCHMIMPAQKTTGLRNKGENHDDLI